MRKNGEAQRVVGVLSCSFGRIVLGGDSPGTGQPLLRLSGQNRLLELRDFIAGLVAVGLQPLG